MGTGETREGTTTPGVIGVGRVMGGSGVAEGLQELETMSGTGGLLLEAFRQIAEK